ncbi:MAG TPA: conjugative transposon protein TraM [Chitinophagaceae bacterium]
MNKKQTESKSLSPHFLRRRKMMLVLPLLVLPFITMAFWALGGGSGEILKREASATSLNLQLPDANLKDDGSETKLTFYEQADRDSIKFEKALNNDPFLKQERSIDTSVFHLVPGSSGLPYNPLPPVNYKDPNEEKVYQKLQQLNEQLNKPVEKNNSNEVALTADKTTSSVNKEDVEKLDRLMQSMNQKDSISGDPELDHLNSMMEKILDIQHPERVKEKIREKSMGNKESIFPVDNVPIISSVSLLDTSAKKENDSNGFFGLEEESNYPEQNAIQAVVNEDQTLVNGAIIKFRLINNISINGNVIPKDNFIFGKASLNGERLLVDINSIRVENSLFPVKLVVYDMDGLPGIYIPGAITRDVAKESLNNTSQMMEISSLDPSVQAQAASAGIGAVKTLLSKKTKLIRVTVKAGYKVLLK